MWPKSLMISLLNITLCALGGEKYRSANQAALDYSALGVKFGAVVNIMHECPTIDDWNRAIVFDLHGYIHTDFALLVHPDGFVVHPDSWRHEFLAYDFVGAPWPLPTDDHSYRDINGDIVRVGNGVSLRSKRLLRLPSLLGWPWQSFFGNTNEDGYISCHYRKEFELRGMRFAPLDVAKHFSREKPVPENVGIRPFAFHRHEGENASYPNFET